MVDLLKDRALNRHLADSIYPMINCITNYNKSQYVRIISQPLQLTEQLPANLATGLIDPFYGIVITQL